MADKRWNRVRRERQLRGLSRGEAAQEIGVSVEAVRRKEEGLPLEPADKKKLERWLHDIGMARLARLDKLEELAKLAASFPLGLAKAALSSLVENADEVFEACGGDDGQDRLGSWAASVGRGWERGGGLRRERGHPDVR